MAGASRDEEDHGARQAQHRGGYSVTAGNRPGFFGAEAAYPRPDSRRIRTRTLTLWAALGMIGWPKRSPLAPRASAFRARVHHSPHPAIGHRDVGRRLHRLWPV